MLFGFPLRLTLDAMNRRSNIYRALLVNPGASVYMDAQRIYARHLEVPAGGAVATARAMARAFHDECLKGDVQFSFGFMKPSAALPFGSASSFGSPGSGGSMGFADPAAGLGYGYVTSQSGTTLSGDPRDVALREALYAALPVTGRQAA